MKLYKFDDKRLTPALNAPHITGGTSNWTISVTNTFGNFNCNVRWTKRMLL